MEAGDYKRLPLVKTRVWTSRKLCRNSSLSATAFSTSCLSKNISELLMTAWTLCLKASMGVNVWNESPSRMIVAWRRWLTGMVCSALSVRFSSMVFAPKSSSTTTT